jgi:hypothetical protein
MESKLPGREDLFPLDIQRAGFSIDEPLTDLEHSEDETPPEPKITTPQQDRLNLRGFYRQDRTRNLSTMRTGRGVRDVFLYLKTDADVWLFSSRL